ncbi:flavin-containing monooxygenase [Nitrospirillum bahiense]|uniref:4-hydroxyacetophenone monooxygenase n=1 Tax=Nitrospirillum amazonense TaxID=28077 RepID=A0A560FVH9_9PROT|nr:NAD(P)/FAD-dependent oxidoreductase [Nitrospirillum amazonense]TWB25648.1 4-hydroxyacetophenone monooxygenase [Nitrospirillum amazonense]
MAPHSPVPVSDARSLPIRDHDGLRQALTDANLPTLLMVYMHYTEDEGMLERFAPHIHSPYAHNPAPVPAELEQELRDRLFGLLTQSPPPVERPLSQDLMRRMMSVGVAETVDEECVPMLLEQMGFETPVPRSSVPGRAAPAGFKVLVIGCGMTGIVAGIKLAEAGYDHVIIEKNPEVGGTWYENRYPGVGVDTPSHFYSFSFEINPEWNHYHPKGHDMQDYLLRVADKYGIRDRTIFNTQVLSCVYDADLGLWHVTVRSNDGREWVIDANAVINAHGPLNRWQLPDMPGLKDFKGPAMHTAAWDTRVDLGGKDVVMIGTGASGVQLAPAIAPSVKHLTILQRSRHWVIRNPEIGRQVTEGVKFALRHIPHYKEWFRYRVYWFAGDGLFVNVVKDPNWTGSDLSVSAHNEGMRQFALSQLQAATADRPDLFEKLLPDHPIFSKRILLDDGWFDTLKRDNVTLENRAVDHIEADAVVLKDGTRLHADVLALATGFNVAKMLGSLTVIGREGADLGRIWGEDDPRSHLGVTIPGFPNFFYTVGPNSAPNHAAGQNLISEVQVNYIIECLDAVVAAGAKAIEPTRMAFDAFNERIDRRMQDMIWTHPKANSYYNNSKGRIFLSWPYRLVDYWTAMRKPDLNDFTLLR